MAREFSKISPSVWTSKTFINLKTDDERYCYIYLLTSAHQNSAGAYRLPPAYAAHDLNWEIERYQKARDGLDGASLILSDTHTNEIFILKWFKHNKPMNPKHRIGAVSLIEKLECEEIYKVAMEQLEEVYPDPDAPLDELDQTTGEIIRYRPNEMSRAAFDKALAEKRAKR